MKHEHLGLEQLKEMELVVDRSLEQIGNKLTEALICGDTEKIEKIEAAFQEHWSRRGRVLEAINSKTAVLRRIPAQGCPV